MYASNGQASRLRPYLTTAQLISLAAFASPIISLLFVLFRLSASSDVAQQSVNEAKNSLQASCLAAERAASVGASLPRYLAQGVNEQITDGVRATMEGVRIGLTLSLTATEALIEFCIDLYRSTFLCLLELVVRGGLSILIASVSEITSFLNNTLTSITTGIAGDIQSANNVIQAAVNVVKNIPFVGGNINIPQFTVPSAAQLANIQIPTTFEDKLKALNGSIPTLDEFREKLDSLISVPFQLLKKEINDTFIASQASFNATLLPLPKENTVTFCGDTISTSFDDLAKSLVSIARTGILIVIASMIILFLGYAFVTWWSQRSLRNNIERIRLLWFGDGNATTDRLLAFDALIAHPIWTQIVQFFSERFHLSQEKYDAFTWFGLYVFHPAPMACLLIGIFGLLSVQIQLAVVGPLSSQYSNQISNDINGLSSRIATKLNETMWQDSTVYARALNERIGAVEQTINTDLFGWVNSTIVPLNTTLANFYSEVQGAVETVFGGTPLEAPAQEFVRCILGSKIVGIEKALTFLQEHLHVDLPSVDEGALVLSQSSVDEVATPISAAAVGSGNNGEDGGLVGKIISRYIDALKKERITFFIFLLLWALVVIVALLIIAWHLWILPALHRRGLREPRWLAGPRWEDSNDLVPDHEKRGSLEKSDFNNLRPNADPTVVDIPSPLRKNHDVVSTSAGINTSFMERMRQRRAGDGRAEHDHKSVWGTQGDESQQDPSILGRIKRFTMKRGGHVAKKNSDSGILPLASAPRSTPVPQPIPRDNPRTGHDWFERLTIWKRETVVDPNLVGTFAKGIPSQNRAVAPKSSEPRVGPGLTVDVAKASTQYSPPRIIVETASTDSQASGRSVTSNRPHHADSTTDARHTGDMLLPRQGSKPPTWVATMKAKELQRSDSTEYQSSTSPSRQPRRQGSGSSSDSNRSAPRRPPGLHSSNDQRSRGTAIKATTTPSSSSYQRGNERGRRHKRNSSVPPRAVRSTPDTKLQVHSRNRSLTRPSQVAVDPFATPRSTMALMLPAPLEPMKTKGNAADAVSLRDPFATPFDDSYAPKERARPTDAPSY
ncbi:plasma membrane fusion protein prm1 [Serendipita sp. 399]|nr:plasma membrane fusion protein prm1 [Serendipita sp. 399]